MKLQMYGNTEMSKMPLLAMLWICENLDQIGTWLLRNKCVAFTSSFIYLIVFNQINVNVLQNNVNGYCMFLTVVIKEQFNSG